MSEFLYMGGYAFYVWTAYGVALIILLFNLISPVMQRRRLLHELARKLERAKSLQ